MTNIRVRRTDPETSVEAAESVEDKLRLSQQAVLEIMRAFPVGLTDTDLINVYRARAGRAGIPQQSESGIRTRRKELVDQGKVFNTGATTTLPSGRRSIIWAVVDE